MNEVESSYKLEREPHLDLKDEADFMESMRKEECLELKKFL